MKSYFLIRVNEDSDGFRVDGPMSQDDLEGRLAAEPNEDCCYYGHLRFVSTLEELRKRDYGMKGASALIIKGEVVIPQPVEVVRKVRLP